MKLPKPTSQYILIRTTNKLVPAFLYYMLMHIKMNTNLWNGVRFIGVRDVKKIETQDDSGTVRTLGSMITASVLNDQELRKDDVLLDRTTGNPVHIQETQPELRFRTSN